MMEMVDNAGRGVGKGKTERFKWTLEIFRLSESRVDLHRCKDILL